MDQWLEIWWFAYIVLPLLIFIARILDVSLGTMRILFITRGLKSLPALLGFFEVFIWMVVISSIMRSLHSPFYYVFYAAGFAAGNYVGISIEQRLRIGKVALRIITRENSDDLIEFFRNKGFGITVVDAHGSRGPVRIFYSIIERANLDSVLDQVKHFNPRAFYSVENVRTVSEGNFPTTTKTWLSGRRKGLHTIPLRKGK